MIQIPITGRQLALELERVAADIGIDKLGTKGSVAIAALLRTRFVGENLDIAFSTGLVIGGDTRNRSRDSMESECIGFQRR